jgi:DNA adenine methylase
MQPAKTTRKPARKHAKTPVETPLVKPLLKWVGGKTQIIDEVISCFPKTIQNYHEPFVGGGSVLIALLSCLRDKTHKVSGKIIASDINKRLIWFYENVRDNIDVIIALLENMVSGYDKSANASSSFSNDANDSKEERNPKTEEEALTSQEEYYYWQRKAFNTMDEATARGPEGAAAFLFLNKTCFRGMYREGPNGFNVPFGNYKKLCIDTAHLKEVSCLLKTFNVEFRCCSFDIALHDVAIGDFIYMDPPYAPESKTSFVGYSKEGFQESQHLALFGLCDKMKNNGIGHLMSNADVELVNNNFDAQESGGYVKKVLSCRRAINAKKPESKTNEVLLLFPGDTNP